MNISDVIGHKVMVLFNSAQGLEKLGIDDNNKYCTIVGYDNIGIWVENPAYEETPLRDAEGKLIPPEDRQPKRFTAHILIPWGNIRSVVHFPDREGKEPELESEEVRPIGSYL